MGVINDLNNQLTTTQQLITSKKTTKANYLIKRADWFGSAELWRALAKKAIGKKKKARRMAEVNKMMVKVAYYENLAKGVQSDIDTLNVQLVTINDNISKYYDAVATATQQGIPEGGSEELAQQLMGGEIALQQMELQNQQNINNAEIRALDSGLSVEEAKQKRKNMITIAIVSVIVIIAIILILRMVKKSKK